MLDGIPQGEPDRALPPNAAQGGGMSRTGGLRRRRSGPSSRTRCRKALLVRVQSAAQPVEGLREQPGYVHLCVQGLDGLLQRDAQAEGDLAGTRCPSQLVGQFRDGVADRRLQIFSALGTCTDQVRSRKWRRISPVIVGMR